MRRLLTLLAVTMAWEGVGSRDAGAENSSTGEIRTAVAAALVALASIEALFLPKPSFHFGGFLVTGGRVEVTEGEGAGAGMETARGAEGWAFLRSATGTACIKGDS
jgi:hypothetical protein